MCNYYEIYERILSNKPFDKKLRPYTKLEFQETLKFLEDKEDYEKCQLLLSLIKKRFDHLLSGL